MAAAESHVLSLGFSTGLVYVAGDDARLGHPLFQTPQDLQATLKLAGGVVAWRLRTVLTSVNR